MCNLVCLFTFQEEAQWYDVFHEDLSDTFGVNLLYHDVLGGFSNLKTAVKDTLPKRVTFFQNKAGTMDQAEQATMEYMLKGRIFGYTWTLKLLIIISAGVAVFSHSHDSEAEEK